MHDIMKGIWGGIVVIGFFGAIFSWLAIESQDVNWVIWVLRIASPVLMIIGFIGFWRLEQKQDSAPDFLTKYFGQFFERNGFCFTPIVSEKDGQAIFAIYYQNRYKGQSSAIVTIIPKTKYLDKSVWHIDSVPAEFGVATAPFGIPLNIQGKSIDFAVTASVQYPNGRGETVRYEIGTDVGGGLAEVVTIKKAQITLPLPQNVNENTPEGSGLTQETLWKWDDSTEKVVDNLLFVENI